MDAVSYSHSAKQAQRIEKFIKNPDSNSGIVTVPKVIGAGESVTVPAGRVAVLPNVQVDGELVVDGEVFIPSGSGLSTVVQKSGDTMSGNLNFASGTKITGDFSNANRTLLQTNILNDNTFIIAAPNGTASMSAFLAFGSSDVVNSHFVQMVARADSVTIDSTKKGTGLYKPLKLGIGGSYSLTLDTSGNTLVTGYGAFGYGTGAGGTVTQLTSKSTAVTLNKPCGQITMNNAALAAGGQVTFSLNNSLITVNDIIVVHCTHANGFAYYVWAGYSTAGSAQVTVKNTAASSLSDAITINFAVIKGAIA